jgi:hypothetical protein
LIRNILSLSSPFVCIFRIHDYINVVCPSLQKFKFNHFGHDCIVLHEHDIRKQKPPFVFLKSEAKRNVFMTELSDIVAAAPMTIIAAVIHKAQLVQRYVQPHDPYELALLFCMERLYAFLQDCNATQATTHVVVERRGKTEDAALELEFRRIKDGANRWGALTCVEIVFADKKANLLGNQLADLTARPIGLKVLLPNQLNRAYEIIEPKMRRSPSGLIHGWGFKVFP